MKKVRLNESKVNYRTNIPKPEYSILILFRCGDMLFKIINKDKVKILVENNDALLTHNIEDFNDCVAELKLLGVN